MLKSGAQIFAALQVAGKSGAVFRGRVAQLRQRDPRLAAYLATTRPLSRALAALTDMGDQEVGAGVETPTLTSASSSQYFTLFLTKSIY